MNIDNRHNLKIDNTNIIESTYSSLVSTVRNIFLIFSVSLAFFGFSNNFTNNKNLIQKLAFSSLILSFVYGVLCVLDYHSITQLFYKKYYNSLNDIQIYSLNRLSNHIYFVSVYLIIILIVIILTFLKLNKA